MEYPFYSVPEDINFPPPDYTSLFDDKETAPSEQSFFAEGGRQEIKKPSSFDWREVDSRLKEMLPKPQEQVVENTPYVDENVVESPKEEYNEDYVTQEEFVKPSPTNVDPDNYDKLSYKQALKKAQGRSDVYDGFRWRGEIISL